MNISRIVSAPQWGNLTPFEDIEVGKQFQPVEWTCTSETLDLLLHCYDMWHEWFVIDSPFGGRVVPPIGLHQVFVSLNPYVFRATPIWEEEQFCDVVRPNKKYIFKGSIAEKYIKDEKPWVLFDYVCTDEDGNTVVHHKHLSSLSEAISSSGKLATDTPDPTQRPVTEAYPYSPPVLEVKDPLQWIRDQDVPISTVTYASKNMPLGAELLPLSTQYTWRRMRDWEQYTYHEFMQWPEAVAAYNIHTHPDAARAFGLPFPTIGTPRYTALVSLMMLNALGKGWLFGGRYSFRYPELVGLWDFVTAKGRLVKTEPEGEANRLTFETWVENQRGERVLDGESSGLVPG